jgi:hypothetical protein
MRKFAYGNEAAEAVLVPLEYPPLFPSEYEYEYPPSEYEYPPLLPSEYEFVDPSEEALAAFPPNM